MNWHPISEILSPGFQISPENAAGVVTWLQDLNDEGAFEVRYFILCQPKETIIELLRVGFELAGSINDNEWMYNMYKMMPGAFITFEDLQFEMPEILQKLLLEIGE